MWLLYSESFTFAIELMRTSHIRIKLSNVRNLPEMKEEKIWSTKQNTICVTKKKQIRNIKERNGTDSVS